MCVLAGSWAATCANTVEKVAVEKKRDGVGQEEMEGRGRGEGVWEKRGDRLRNEEVEGNREGKDEQLGRVW